MHGSSGRRGFTLMEALVAVAIAGTLCAALADLFLGTQHGAAMSEERFDAALLAHGAAERLRARVVSDPSSLRRAASAGPVAPGELLGAEWARLADYRVNVEVADDVDLEPARGEPQLAALVKKVTITVTRPGFDAPGAAPAARLVVRIATPPDSLDDGQLDALYRAHAEPWPLDRTWQMFYDTMGMQGDPNFTPQSPVRKDYQLMLGDALSVVATANAIECIAANSMDRAPVPGSHQLPAPGFSPRPIEQMSSMLEWCGQFRGPGSTNEGVDDDRLRLAAQAEAQVPGAYLSGAHQAAPALADLDARVTAFVAAESAHLDQLTAKVKPAHDLLVQLKAPGITEAQYDAIEPQLRQAVAALDADPDLKPGGALWESFYTAYSLWYTLTGYSPHRRVLDQMSQWAHNFEWVTAGIPFQLVFWGSSAVASPFERTEVARLIVYLGEVALVAHGGPVPSVPAYDHSEALTNKKGDPDLLRYIQDPANQDPAALATRHARWLEDWLEVEQLSNPDAVIVGNYALDQPHHLHAVLGRMDSGKLADLCETWQELVAGPPKRP